MKYPRFLGALLWLSALALAHTPALAGTDVGVSISIGEPGFFGKIDINAGPRPQLIYPQPVIIERGPTRYAPIYLHVPPGHERNWGRHCRRYHACGRPVYFVRDTWYNQVYVPDYRGRHGRRDDRGHGPDDRPDDHDERGPGGHGHGRGHDR